MIVRELEVTDLPIPGSFLIRPKEFADERGVLRKLFTEDLLRSRHVEPLFSEEYLSISGAGVLRGLHYQVHPFPQAKLVACLEGKIFDVMVDLRKKSGSYGRWASVQLSGEEGACLYVPRGVAHGSLSLVDGSAVLHKSDGAYSPAHERGIVWSDASLAISWPKMEYVISDKDRAWPSFSDADKFD